LCQVHAVFPMVTIAAARTAVCLCVCKRGEWMKAKVAIWVMRVACPAIAVALPFGVVSVWSRGQYLTAFNEVVFSGLFAALAWASWFRAKA
jgi:hypothetical protein